MHTIGKLYEQYIEDKDYYPLPWERDDKDSEHGNQEETEKQSLAKGQDGVLPES